MKTKPLFPLLGLSVALIFALAGAPLRATPVVDNNAGKFFDDYADKSGIVPPSSQVQISPPGMVSLVAPAGDFRTVEIKPSSFSQWEKLTLVGSYGALNDLQVEVYDLNGGLRLGPLPVNAPISLASLNSPLVPGIQVRVRLSKTAEVSPTVNSLEVKWQPASQLLLDKQGPIAVQAGENIVYSIRYSVSFIEAQDLVVWDTLPSAQAGTLVYPRAYGQNDDVIFVSATKGGQPTGSSSKLINGVNIPANSIYWTFSKVPEGTSDLLSFTVATRNGTLNLTRATNCAFAKAANATLVKSPCVVTTIHSVSSPFMDKLEGTGIFDIGGVLQTSFGKVNSFRITARNNFQPTGVQTMYNAVVYDNVSDLIGMIVDVGGNGPDAADFSNILPSDGVFNPAYVPDGGGPAIPAIVWPPRALAPGATFSGSFSVQLVPGSARLQYDNRACLTSDQTSPTCDQLTVKLPLSNGTGGEPPGGGVGFTKTASAKTVPYGGTVAFYLALQNRYAVKLNDIVLLDKVPAGTTFRSAWINAPDLRASGAKIFYSTSTSFGDPNTPPDLAYGQAVLDDLDSGANNYWESYALNPPANPAAVTWVAYYIPQVDSVFLPNEGTPALPPSTPITSASVSFDVNVLVPVDPCTDLVLPNHALFQAYQITDLFNQRMENPDGTLTLAADAKVVAKGYKGKLSAYSGISPDPVTVPGVATYSVTVANDNSATSDALAGVEAVLQLSQVAVNGVLQYPSVQPLPTGYNLGPGPGQITIPIGFMAAGATRHLTLPLSLPAGVPNEAEYTVAITVTGQDNQCGASTATASARGRVQSSPKLTVRKSARADLIPSGAAYDYELLYQNLGTGPSTRTWIVDRVPERTVLGQAFGNSHITEVRFSYDDDLPPQALTPFNSITAKTITDHFTKGTLVTLGNADPTDDYWIPSGGGDPTKVYWVAWLVDDPAVNPPQLTINAPRSVGLRVKNDHDSQGPSTGGSPKGTCWPNSAAIFSDQLLQAIGNQVLTCVDDNPSIVVEKTGPLVVEAGVPFEWVVTYHNDTLSNPDDTVIITDFFPPGITFLSATHTWNGEAVGNNAPGGAVAQTVTPGISSQGGATVLTFPIAGVNGYRGNGSLRGLEGGKLILTVKSAEATPCGSTRLNEVRAVATTATETKESVASHQVTILCPDLELLKSVSPATVLADGLLTYQVEIANRGGIPAREVALTDFLPAGVTFVPGSQSIQPVEYSPLAPPNVVGQTLTWSVATGNALTHAGLLPGVVPVTTGNIIIRFNARVANNIAACSTLINTARVSTVSVQPGLYPTNATASAKVPPPELSVAKSGPDLALPGTRVTWNISWANSSLQPAAGVYLVDTLPDSNQDLISDVSFVKVYPPDGVTAYYHSGPSSPGPAFNPAAPLDGGWTDTPVIPVNHIALLVGPLAHSAVPFNAEMTVDLLDPLNPALRPDAGVCFTNRVAIFRDGPADCEDISDNTDSAVVCTPKLDLSLTKRGSAQGPLPGIAPGQPITYTISFQNNGTVPARGVRVTDTLPAGLLAGDPLDNFKVLTLVDSAGSPCSPVNHLTGLPIVGDVKVTWDINDRTWYLGTTNPSDDHYYRNVQLPPGCRGTFELYVTVAGTVPDNTGICNEATVTADEGDEDFLSNNTGQSCVTVRRADLAVTKSGFETSSGDPDFVERGGLITYDIKYNNLGGLTAQDVVIRDYLPEGTTLVSVVPPLGGTVTYSPNQAEATSFEVRFPSLPAPANSVGGTGNSNPTGAGGQPRLFIQLVGRTVEVTWDAAYDGFILQQTPQVGPTFWTRVTAPVLPFPANRIGVTLPASMPASFFRLCGTPAVGCSPGTNQYSASVSADCFLNWSRLFVKDTVPEGSVATYSVLRRTGNELFALGAEYTHVNIGPDGLDISGINRLYTDLVLRTEYSLTTGTNSPCLEAWQFTYASPCWPSFPVTVRVDSERCGKVSPIVNLVTITTITPEIREDNNTDRHAMSVRLTDLEVTCASAAAILENETLTHTINWQVNGPLAALDAYLLVALPDADGNGSADVLLDSVTPGSGVNVYYNTAATLAPVTFDPHNPVGWTLWTPGAVGVNHLAFDLGSPDPERAGVILYTVSVKPGTAGRSLCSSVTAWTARRDEFCENNSCLPCTFVGALANVHVAKTGPGSVHPGDVVPFRITYGNNGKAIADNVVVRDFLPAGLIFDHADPLPSGVNGQTLTWDNLGALPGTLAVMETKEIIVWARLTNDCTVVGKKLLNVVTITTSSGQVNLADDYAEALLDSITADTVSLGGRVYQDSNGNCEREAGEGGIKDVTITLTGTVPCGDPITLTTLTDSDGRYNFPGLPPGTYTLTETQPFPWVSTGDELGTAGGMNALPLDNVLGPIPLNGGETAVEYNFCERAASAPVLVGVPGNTNYQCLGDVPPPPIVSATGGCDSNAVVTLTVLTNGSCPMVLTYTWIARDECGNRVSATSIVTVHDTTPPVLTNCPSPTLNLGCNPTAIPECDPAVGATDNCGAVTVACARVDTTNGCARTRTLTYTAVDNCGNRATCTQTITWTADSTVPTLVCPSDKTVECGEAWTFDPPTAFDGCSGTNVTLTLLSTVTNGICPEVITRTWIATDLCGNTNTCHQKVTVVYPTSYTFSTLAGGAGQIGDVNDTGSAARFNYPRGVAVDGAGNVYVADASNHLIRKITPAGVVATLAGSAGEFGDANGIGGAARFKFPRGVAVDTAGNLYVADTENHTIRKITPTGEVTTLAGSAGLSGSDDGPTSAARFNLPQNLAVDSSGNVYVADTSNHTVRKITPAGEVTTLAGLAGVVGNDNGIATTARFHFPRGVAVDSTGNVYVADTDNHTIRLITPAGVVTTLAGSPGALGSADGTRDAARFSSPRGVAVDGAGNLLVADQGNNTIRRITPAGVVTTLAGSAGVLGSANGNGSAARFDYPSSVAVDPSANLYVGDTENQMIRKGVPVSPTLTCAANKTVEYGSPWDFDPPTAVDPCTGTAVAVSILSTVTNGLCPQEITRTWLAADPCGRSNTCSQTVTITDTTPPVFTCATNKAVECGAPWSFDAPTALDARCGSNVTLTIVGTVTNGDACRVTITRTWQATDCCTNSATCSQTVTITDTTPPVITCTTNKTVECPGPWSFDEPTVTDTGCGTNLTLTVVSTETNGSSCQAIIKRTWRATDGCSNSATCSQTVTLTPPSGLGLCSLTQGAYGNAKGKFGGTTHLALIGNLLAPETLVVGKAGSRSLSIQPGDAALLQQYLPAGGTPSALPSTGVQNQMLQTAVLPLTKGKFNNVFLGQTITLSLNVRLRPGLLNVGIAPSFCTQAMLAGADGLPGTADDVPVTADRQMFLTPSSVITALTDPGINDLTVKGLLDLANRALAGWSTSPASVADINAAVDAINRGFDECRVRVDCATGVVIQDSFNDDFANRPTLGSGGGPGAMSGGLGGPAGPPPPPAACSLNLRTRTSNINAAKEPGEPNHPADAGGKSVWWQWRAPRSGPVVIQTAGSSFDTLLAVYAGTNFSNLALVASSDDADASLTSEVTFQAVINADYQIAVDGFAGNSGAIVLTLLLDAPKIERLTLLPNGGREIRIEGDPTCPFNVEGSSDLMNWTPISTTQGGDGALRFTDPEASNSGQRFYRVQLQL